MNWATQCAAVIPCLNEAATIETIARELRRQLPTVFVVDDGSTDRTAALAVAAGATVLRTDRNRGKGASLKAGWTRAQQAGFPWALSLDGDGQHALEDIPAFFHCVEQTSARLVVGNRMHDPAAMPRLRRIVNRWMSRQISKVAGIKVPDSQCGFRLMNLPAWSTLPIQADHFEIESDVLLSFIKAGHRVEFVPIRTVYKTEQSKINPVRDTIRWFRWWRGV